MPGSKEPRTRIPFGPFEADLLTQELRKHGIRLPLPRQSFQILKMLLERRGELVTREELRAALWPSDTFVDFEHSLNPAVNKLRDALGDTADDPRYIETLPRRGYRYVGGVEAEPGPAQQSAAQPSRTSSSAVIAAAKQHRWAVTTGVFAVLVLIGAAAFGVYSLLHGPASKPFQNFTLTQVTNTGKAARAAISPDGRYVLSVMDDNGLESLWLRNVPTDSDTQVIPPSGSHYESLSFSPDGNYIYFRKIIEPNAGCDLYRSPILGGAPQLLVHDVWSDIAFSPDAQRIAYVRFDNPEVGKYRILTASLDGNDEKVLWIGTKVEEPISLAWSPHGADEIAYSLYPHEQGRGAIDVLDVGTGKSHRWVTFSDKFVGAIQWSP
jgi:DNA-binding winged helix-turn-helix (wHTH) protein